MKYDPKELVEMYFSDPLIKIKDVAKKFNVDRETAAYHIRKTGRYKRIIKTSPYSPDFKRAVTDYWFTNPNVPMRDIGKKFGVSYESVSQWISDRLKENFDKARKAESNGTK